MYELNICHLYPDLLNMYGDRGNTIALKKRCEWRGISANITNVSLGESFIPEKYDIVLLGGGQDYEQEIIQQDFVAGKGKDIKNAIENGIVFLCICGGYQLMGRYFKTRAGKRIEFLGALDLYTVAEEKRMIGNIVFECSLLNAYGNTTYIVGFENHSGNTFLGPSVKPLGRVLKGYGNNGVDGCEGAVYKNTFCSYAHGSLLPKNPILTDHLIVLALKRKYSSFVSLCKLDDILENTAHDSMLKRIVE